jgi:hypothetical protein
MILSFPPAIPLLLAIAWLPIGQAGAATGSWEKVKTEAGVEIFEKKINGKLVFRGIGEIAGEPAKLVGIIENPARWKHWIDNFQSGRLVDKKSAFHKVFYQSFDSPFPVSDRDLVYESRISRDAKSGTVWLAMKSVRHPKAPKTVGVRVSLTYTIYKIEPKGGNKMKVTFETMSDPGGAIPSFMANWATRSYPVTLFEGLRREMKRPDQKEAPLPR